MTARVLSQLRQRCALYAGITLLLAAPLQASPSGRATFTTIDPPGADTSICSLAVAINDLRQIVGGYCDGITEHGYILQNGVYSNVDPPGAAIAEADGINIWGDIVGVFCSDAACSDGLHGFLDRRGVFTTVDFPGASVTFVDGISDLGVIVGGYCLDPSCANEHGFVLFRNQFATLDAPGTVSTELSKINLRGDIAGFDFDSAGSLHGFVFRNGSFQNVAPPGSVVASARGINFQEDIVGRWDDSSGNTHGYLRRNGKYTSVDYPGAPFTRATDINIWGDIVGDWIDADFVNEHGYLVTGFGQASILPSGHKPDRKISRQHLPSTIREKLRHLATNNNLQQCELTE